MTGSVALALPNTIVSVLFPNGIQSILAMVPRSRNFFASANEITLLVVPLSLIPLLCTYITIGDKIDPGIENQVVVTPQPPVACFPTAYFLSGRPRPLTTK